MKVDTTVSEVIQGQKTFLRLLQAEAKIQTISKRAVARYNNLDIGWFAVTKDEIRVYPSKDGEVNHKLLRFLDKHMAVIVQFAKKVAWDNTVEFYSDGFAKAKMIVWLMANWNKNWSKSPYGDSFYSSKEISWDYKQEGSLRVSDHWNFNTRDELGLGIKNGQHCPTHNKNFKSRWAVGQFVNGAYKILKTF